MRVIVTGASGFVGPYFIDALRNAAPQSEIVECARHREPPGLERTARALDITDSASVDAIIAEVRPTHVMHLAGISSVRKASANPRMSWAINVFGTLNLANAILRYAPDCVLVFAGSGEVYGASSNRKLPLTEEALLEPISEYAVTKAAADLAIGALAGAGLRSIRFRPFNHVGPGQTEDYALSSFAAQIARIEAGIQPAVVRVGNLDAARDFLDVRDVADAYVKAAVGADRISSGTVFNIACGKPRRLDTILDRLVAMAQVGVRIELDPARLRPSDLPVIYGDASRAKQMLNWTPSHDFDETLQEMLVSWRKTVGRPN